ncbi:MAG: DUF1566 domain-containing protein [Balneolaceae bacterium]|nr:DUF1566 domain-containing protein [Balneolaceae bacterium]
MAQAWCVLKILVIVLIIAGCNGNNNSVSKPLDTNGGNGNGNGNGSDSDNGQPSDQLETTDKFTLEAQVGDGGVILSWNAMPGATSYNLYYATEAGLEPDNYAVYDNGTLVIGVTSPYTLSGLDSSTTYYAVVTTVIGSTEEFTTNQVSVTTKAALVAAIRPLNDTGIDWCADSSNINLNCPAAGFFGQDGDYGRDAQAQSGTLTKLGSGASGFDFTKVSSSGATLSVGATEWACVRDNVTGLIWEVKTSDGGLQDKSHTYTWYNPDNTTNGGREGFINGGVCSNGDCDTYGYVLAVNENELCGANDWRMPTRKELLSIMHNGQSDVRIDLNYFPNTSGSWFLTSTPVAFGVSYNAWRINFGSGRVSRNLNFVGSHASVRLVRSED